MGARPSVGRLRDDGCCNCCPRCCCCCRRCCCRSCWFWFNEPGVRSVDSILHIDSINGARGWSVTRLDKEWAPSRVVGLVGRVNCGRTFVLEKMANMHIARDALHTEGISILRFNEGKVAALDTCGLDRPVRNSSNNEGVMNQRATEEVTKRITVSVADAIVIVTGEPTVFDQLIVRDVAQRARNKPVIVVHNLQRVGSQQALERYWQTDIVGTFGGELMKEHAQFLDGTVNAWYSESHGIQHFVFGNDDVPEMAELNADTARKLTACVLGRTRAERRPPLLECLATAATDCLRELCADGPACTVSSSEPVVLLMSKPLVLLPVAAVQDEVVGRLRSPDTVPPYDVLEDAAGLYVVVDLPQETVEVSSRWDLSDVGWHLVVSGGRVRSFTPRSTAAGDRCREHGLEERRVYTSDSDVMTLAHVSAPRHRRFSGDFVIWVLIDHRTFQVDGDVEVRHVGGVHQFIVPRLQTGGRSVAVALPLPTPPRASGVGSYDVQQGTGAASLRERPTTPDDGRGVRIRTEEEYSPRADLAARPSDATSRPSSVVGSPARGGAMIAVMTTGGPNAVAAVPPIALPVSVP